MFLSLCILVFVFSVSVTQVHDIVHAKSPISPLPAEPVASIDDESGLVILSSEEEKSDDGEWGASSTSDAGVGVFTNVLVMDQMDRSRESADTRETEKRESRDKDKEEKSKEEGEYRAFNSIPF